jgi:hypothetical protein
VETWYNSEDRLETNFGPILCKFSSLLDKKGLKETEDVFELHIEHRS